MNPKNDAPRGRVVVIGAGTMGRGIAQLCAQRGFSTTLYDAAEGIAAGALDAVRVRLADAVDKGKLSVAERDAARAHIRAVERIEDAGPADVVIEAIVEDLAAKRAAFAELEKAFPGTILATNTSSFRVAEIAGALAEPGRAVGLHFFNPPVATKLIEVIGFPGTSAETLRRARDFVEALGKTPVAARDTPGFIVNRVVRPFYLQGLRLAGEGAGTFAALDAELRLKGGLPMGPFELMDLIGVDVNLAITKSIHEALGRPERLRPHPIQEALVAAGGHGRKTGIGFYRYQGGRLAGENPRALKLLPKPVPAEKIWERLRDAIIAEAELLVGESAAAEADVDLAVRLAMNFPKGPFEWKKDRGAKK